MQINEYTSVTEEQTNLTFGFIKVLFEEDVNEYWSLISKVDKARVLGMYKIAKDLKEGISFHDYVKYEFMYPQREIYEKVKENSGLASHLRYTDEGEPVVYLLENITEPIVYEEATQVKVFPVTLTLDTEVNNNEIITIWKVRLYFDKEYEIL